MLSLFWFNGNGDVNKKTSKIKLNYRYVVDFVAFSYMN